MLACKHCSTQNSLDSTFCKKCGTAVPTDAKREATLQLDKLVDEGLAALSAGRSAEALAIADAAIATDPTHLGALQLKSAVHERRGEIADALESAERIVELNPDSELDRIKRNGLRTSLLNASTPVAPDRRIAFAAAAAAMVLVACAGILIARKPAATTPATQQVASNLGTPENPVVDAPVVVTPTQAKEVPPRTATPVANDSVRVGNYDLPTRDPGITRDPAPLPRPEGGIGNVSVQPIVPDFKGQTLPSVNGETPGREGNGGPAKTSIPAPVIKKGDDTDPQPLRPEDSKGPQGTYEISISKPGARLGGSRMMDTGTNGAAAYARVGSERYGLGDYAGAAANLEKAVSGGGGSVDLHLRLAQAYDRLGRKSDAAAAYERTRAAADAALASGKGNKELLQEQRATADAALKTVRG